MSIFLTMMAISCKEISIIRSPGCSTPTSILLIIGVVLRTAPRGIAILVTILTIPVLATVLLTVPTPVLVTVLITPRIGLLTPT